MTVLFVSSGNSTFGLSPIVKNQAVSLNQIGIVTYFYQIKGKGVLGYLSNIRLLYKEIIRLNPDVIHAHYSYSGFLASLFSFKKPIIVSLMGSDVKANSKRKYLIRFFGKYFWKGVIAKSDELKRNIGLLNIDIIPNGVNLEIFKPLNKIDCKKKLGWNTSKLQLLFLADITRKEKNFELAEKAFNSFKTDKIELKTANNLTTEEVLLNINAADIVLLSSLWEGSPNVIKEAMACNKLIVSTKVGDLIWLFKDTRGHFLAETSVEDFSLKISKAIDFLNEKKVSNGRQRIKDLNIDSKSIAERIHLVYKRALK